MEDMGVQPEQWSLTQQALDAFLARLDADRNKAGLAYEQIRRKLVTFFRVNGSWDEAEQLADTTLDRVIRRSEEVQVRELPGFIRGVARRVSSERHRTKVRPVPLDDTPEIVRKANPVKDPAEQAIAENLLGCLDKCANQLRPVDRELIFEFYRFDGGQKIEARKKLAAAYGITPDTLRVKAFRVRRELEACMTKCVKSDSTP